MKQQCYVAMVYATWALVLLGLVFFTSRGEIVQAASWFIVVSLFLWLYVRKFPALSPLMGYGSVADRPATEILPAKARVTLYTGAGCPFCPLVKRRLRELQQKMGFELEEKDVTLRPDLAIAKGIRALPVVEIGNARWIGNGTSEELVHFIAGAAATIE